jgi:HTH-type transcriptional regulator, sugar sensing transcriptional regulator
MLKKHIQLLHDLGLQESEAKVYFAALELGPSSVQDIARKAELSRTATYTAIELLESRKIFNSEKRGKKTVYLAEQPEHLLAHLKSEVRRMQEKAEVMEASLEEIKLATGGDKPTVRFYEGMDVVRVLAQEVTKKDPGMWREMVNFEDVATAATAEDLAVLRKAFGKRKREVRILHHGEVKRPLPGREYRRIRGHREIHGDINIYGDTVAVLTMRKKIVMAVIENADIASTMRQMFDLAWDRSE